MSAISRRSSRRDGQPECVTSTRSGQLAEGQGSRELHLNRSSAAPRAVPQLSPAQLRDEVPGDHLDRGQQSSRTGLRVATSTGVHSPISWDRTQGPWRPRGTCEEVDRLLKASPRSGATASPMTLQGSPSKGLRSRASEVSIDSDWQWTPGTPGTPWIPPPMRQHASKNRGNQEPRGPRRDHPSKGRPCIAVDKSVTPRGHFASTARPRGAAHPLEPRLSPLSLFVLDRSAGVRTPWRTPNPHLYPRQSASPRLGLGIGS